MTNEVLYENWKETLVRAQKRLEYVSWGIINAIGHTEKSRELAKLLPLLEEIIGKLDGFIGILK